MTVASPPSRWVTQGGPPLPIVASVFTILFVAGLVASSILGGGAFPSPFGDPAVLQAYFAAQRTAVLVGSVFQFAAAVPLAIFAAAVFTRLQQLGVRAAAGTIALAGGLLASAFGTLSALFQWVLSRPATSGEPVLVRALHDLAFLTGGPAHVVAFGLLLAGIAVPALIVDLLPRWLAIVGLVLAVAAEVSMLALVVPELGVLLPLARFSGMVWLIAAGAMLPAARSAAGRPSESGPASST